MKKFLLFAAAAMAAMPMMAEDNFILNGNIETSTPDGEQQCPDDWTIGGAGVWSGRVTVHEFGDDVQDPAGVTAGYTNFVRTSLYDWNSYGNTTCSQMIELIEIIPTYEFSYLWQAVVSSVRGVETDGVLNQNPVKLWVSILPCDDSGVAEADAEPLYTNEVVWNSGDEYFTTDWAAVKANVDVPEEVMYILVQVGVNGQSGNDSQGGKGQNVVQMNATGFSLTKAGEGAVSEIEAGNVVSVKYYGIDGVEVINPAQGQLVIEKQTLENGAVKVAKKVVR